MDKRIPAEPPIPVQAFRHEAVELKVQQGVHKEAFDAALQQAEQRKAMSKTDRLVTAGKKQADIAQASIANSASNNRAYQRLNTLSSTSAFQCSESNDKERQAERSEQSSGLVRAEFTDIKSSAVFLEDEMPTCSNYRLSTDSLLLLREKINISHCGQGETIAIALSDDPSGVVEIKLTKGLHNSWAVQLSIQSGNSFSASDEAILSEDLKAYLCGCAILVKDVSINMSASTENSAGDSLMQGDHGS